MKKVQVQMSDECHAVLKDFANAWGMTMSDVMYECARTHIHKMSQECPFVQSIFKYKQIKLDHRALKICYGQKCFACKYITSCRTGLYSGTFQMSERASALYESYSQN